MCVCVGGGVRGNTADRDSLEVHHTPSGKCNVFWRDKMKEVIHITKSYTRNFASRKPTWDKFGSVVKNHKLSVTEICFFK